MLFDYETLRVIWWGLLGILLIGFAIMDGFDLGTAICLPWIAHNDSEKRILINSVGPTWEGNQVWFILGGGAIFAAWPSLYALSFSGFYLAMLTVLLALILRPVGFKYRSKLPHTLWRNFWDIALFIGGFVPALIFGVAIGNVIQGIPYYFDDVLRPFYTGTFLGLLNPFALLCGVLSVVMLTMHGACFINLKTENNLQKRAVTTIKWTSLLTILLFITGGLWVYQHIPGYHLTTVVPHDGPSNPLYKSVAQSLGDWFNNYKLYPITAIVPATGILGSLLANLFAARFAGIGFIASGLSIAGIIGTVGVSMFPFLLPSSTHPSHSLLIWDSSSSQLTLLIMLIATVIFFPIVLGYTIWVYRILRGKVTDKVVASYQEIAY